jgi:hypothetical protein
VNRIAIVEVAVHVPDRALWGYQDVVVPTHVYVRAVQAFTQREGRHDVGRGPTGNWRAMHHDPHRWPPKSRRH